MRIFAFQIHEKVVKRKKSHLYYFAVEDEKYHIHENTKTVCAGRVCARIRLRKSE